FPSISVDSVAWHSLEPVLMELTILPVGKERTDHPISHLKLCHSLTNGDDLTGAVRHGNPLFLGAHHAGHYAVVVIVQRAGADTDGDFTGARGWDRAGLDGDAIQASLGRNINGCDSSHAVLLIVSVHYPLSGRQRRDWLLMFLI